MNEDYYSYIPRFFKRWAPIYNIITLPLSKIRDDVADFFDAKEGSKILDVCCGTDGQTFAFAKKGYEVIGIDFTEEMLEIAKRNNKYKNVRFETADATVIPFEDDYFDASSISFGLHDMPSWAREKVLAEMKRVSKEVVIVDYNIPKNKFYRCLRISLISLYESKYFKDFARQNLEELLRQHGLKVTKEAYMLADFIKILVCRGTP